MNNAFMGKRRVCGSFVKSDVGGMILFTVAAESLKSCAASTRTLAGVPVARAVLPAVSASRQAVSTVVTRGTNWKERLVYVSFVIEEWIVRV